MYFASILVLTDFTAAGDKAVERAAQIALGHGAALRLMGLSGHGRTPCPDPQHRLRQTAQALTMRFGLQAQVEGLVQGALEDMGGHARTADLVVLPQRSGRSLGRWLLGPDALRMIRMCQSPVLVARGAVRRRLRQVVVGVDFTPAARHRAMLACLLDLEAEVELFHAVDMGGEAHLRREERTGDAIRNQRDRCMASARLQLRSMTQMLLDHGHSVATAALRGAPAAQLVARQQWVGADLLVVGKQRRHALADCWLRSTAHQVLDQARSDVLLVPHDFQLSSTGATAQPVGRADTAAGPVPA